MVNWQDTHNQTSVFPSYFCFLLQISTNVFIFYPYFVWRQLFLTMFFEEILSARDRPELIPSRMPNVWPLCYENYC